MQFYEQISTIHPNLLKIIEEKIPHIKRKVSDKEYERLCGIIKSFADVEQRNFDTIFESPVDTKSSTTDYTLIYEKIYAKLMANYNLSLMAKLHKQRYEFLLKTDINDYHYSDIDRLSGKLVVYATSKQFKTDNPNIFIDNRPRATSLHEIEDNYLAKYYEHIKSIIYNDKLDKLVISVDSRANILMEHPLVVIAEPGDRYYNEKMDVAVKHRYLALKYYFFDDDRFTGWGINVVNGVKIQFMVKRDIEGFKQTYGLENDPDIVFEIVEKIVVRYA